jgi:hypothetical protein
MIVTLTTIVGVKCYFIMRPVGWWFALAFAMLATWVTPVVLIG